MRGALDDGVGAILAALRRAGIAPDTLVSFASDHGCPTNTGVRSKRDLLGVKRVLLEGGIRVPLLAPWGGRIEEPGRIVEEPVSLLDVVPTALELADVPASSRRGEGAHAALDRELDGPSSRVARRGAAMLAVVLLAVVLSLVVSGAPAARAQAPSDPMPVRVEGGLLRGAPSPRDPAIRVYRGVPYAAPPVGEGRFRPPRALEPWAGVRDATAEAPPCLQVERPGAVAEGSAPATLGSEDCLYLNVWTGAAPGERRPVLVWIHGGGLRRGSASEPSRDGAALAARGLVVVSVAYRLGPLGFFAHPALSAEAEHRSSGTYGLLDVVAALRWIERNIAELGGDPERVTIFGQSGGARMVSYLQATPLAVEAAPGAAAAIRPTGDALRLFHRVIAHSGGSFEERVHLRDPPPGGESAEAMGERWAAAVLGDAAGRATSDGAAAGAQGGVAPGQRDVAAALRAVPGPDLVARVEALLPHYAVPVDGWALPDTTSRLFASGRQADVPVLLGWNADEAVGMADAAGAPSDLAEYRRRVLEEYGTAAAAFETLYPPAGDARAAFLRGHGVRTFGWNMSEWARLTTAARSPVFVYYFARGRGGRIAQHGAELPYVFGNLDAVRLRPGARGFDERDRAFSSAMMGYWTAFAATGDPNGDGRPRWPPRTARGDETMVFGEEIEVGGDVRADEIRFFSGFYDDRLRSGEP